MNHPSASRSGRPVGAAGPLASLVVGLLAAVGLGCAAVGVAPSSAVGVGPVAAQSVTGSTSRLDSTSGLEAIELRRTARSATTPSEPPTVAEPDPKPLPDFPVVDAAPKAPPNTKPAQPARLQIADVDIDVEVRPTGVTEDGSMELPGTVRRAGWYEFGATPRDRVGTTVIAAHVDTKTEGLGPFSRLSSLRRSERIVVTDRGGEEHTYRVVSRRLVVAAKLPVDDLFDRNGSPRLVLLTCGGAYDARSGYRDNVVVTAEPDR